MAKTSQQPQIPIPIDDLIKWHLGNKGYRSSVGTLRKLLNKLTRSEIVLHGGPSGIKKKLIPKAGSEYAGKEKLVFGIRPDRFDGLDASVYAQEYSMGGSVYAAKGKKKDLKVMAENAGIEGGVVSKKALKILSETRMTGTPDAREKAIKRAMARAGKTIRQF